MTSSLSLLSLSLFPSIHCSRSFSYFSCDKPLCESARDALEKNRRKKLSMNYVLKLKTCPDNAACSRNFGPSTSKPFEKSNLTPPLGLRILPLFEDSKIDLDTVDDTIVSDTSPLSQFEPQICLCLTKYKKRHHKP